jgi:hypothetical protein
MTTRRHVKRRLVHGDAVGGSREGRARVLVHNLIIDRRRGSPFVLRLAVRATSRVLVAAPGDARGGQPRAPGLSYAQRTSSTHITTLHEGISLQYTQIVILRLVSIGAFAASSSSSMAALGPTLAARAGRLPYHGFSNFF